MIKILTKRNHESVLTKRNHFENVPYHIMLLLIDKSVKSSLSLFPNFCLITLDQVTHLWHSVTSDIGLNLGLPERTQRHQRVKPQCFTDERLCVRHVLPVSDGRWTPVTNHSVDLLPYSLLCLLFMDQMHEYPAKYH